jgi:NADH-quinone oxidoreductase subunit G
MSTVSDKVQSDTVTIEVDGVSLEAPRGAMIIEVTDAAGVGIPRFCYHKKLSIVANCRMCLVEVEKAPKPLPACATPVTDGMKVYTRSPKAIEAQQGTMEFLLINHPLDCPICDQGGECDLQEMSIGYGADRSDYAEAKRVVKDKDIGPLIETEMTRCIHCTRCVRFGDEIAGIRELGATGRGEDMRIGTYIEKAVESELSGNVIDLCPVGALTSKPFRYTARAWEMQRHSSVSPHDCAGSCLTVLTRGHKVMRVDPRENEAINECWLSDRDRFAYEGLNSPDRLTVPMIRRDGRWERADWNTALEAAVTGLGRVREQAGAAHIGTLASPGSTLEELYLAQQLTRALGSHNIDHRLRQLDFRDQERAPLYPSLGQPIAALETVDAALLVGSRIRKEQPILAHRLRKAALKGAAIMFVNPVAWDCNFPVAANIAADPAGMVRRLAAIARAIHDRIGAAFPQAYAGVLESATVDEETRAIAARLVDARQGTVLLGGIAGMHPDLSALRSLAALIAQATGSTIGYLSDRANGAGAWLSGAVPHRGPAGERIAAPGLDARAMFERNLKGWLLVNVEPEFDAADPARAVDALKQADCVVALTPYDSESMREYADILLPVTPFTETSGTFVNAEGRWQGFGGVVPPAGEARPAWKVLRVLGNLFALPGFDYLSAEEVRDALRRAAGDAQAPEAAEWSAPPAPDAAAPAGTVMRVGHVPIYAGDNIVRRAGSLQQTGDAREAAVARTGHAVAERLGFEDGCLVRIRQGSGTAELRLAIDERVADDCVLLPSGMAETRNLGPAFGPVILERRGRGQ